MALSPDGSKLVYAATKDGVAQLYLRARNQMTTIPIRDTQDARHPFFSPDGEWIGFFTNTELKKVPVSGGPAQTLCKTATRAGASWGSNDTIVFAAFDEPGLMQVPASGGEPKPLTTAEVKTGTHRWPHFLPDGKTLVFTICHASFNWQLAMFSLDTKNYRILIDGTDGRLDPSGYLVFAREASLWAVPFDSSRLELTGKAVPIIEGVQVNGGGWAHYSLANDGSLAYLPAGFSSSKKLVWVDRQGKEEPLAVVSNDYRHPSISPDGSSVALTVASSGGGDIWTFDLIRETLTRLTFDDGNHYSVWSRDGKRIAFHSDRDHGIYWKAADGTGKDEPLGSVPGRELLPGTWSGDGKILIALDSAYDIGSLSMEGDRKWKTLLQEKYRYLQPQISDDGRWMAYTSDASAQFEVYVCPFPEVSNGRWQISTAGGNSPLWSSDGRELFYRNGDSVMAVTVQTRPTFKAGKPEILFRGSYENLELGIDLRQCCSQ
jgi:serine/threonine-protein kinase